MQEVGPPFHGSNFFYCIKNSALYRISAHRGRRWLTSKLVLSLSQLDWLFQLYTIFRMRVSIRVLSRRRVWGFPSERCFEWRSIRKEILGSFLETCGRYFSSWNRRATKNDLQSSPPPLYWDQCWTQHDNFLEALIWTPLVSKVFCKLGPKCEKLGGYLLRFESSRQEKSLSPCRAKCWGLS